MEKQTHGGKVVQEQVVPKFGKFYSVYECGRNFNYEILTKTGFFTSAETSASFKLV